MAQTQQDLNHLYTLSHIQEIGGKALERRYNELKKHYASLNVSTKYTHNQVLFEGALRCGVELANNPTASLPSTLERSRTKILASQGFLHFDMLSRARKALRQAGRNVEEAEVLFRELQASLEKLEMAERATAVHRRWSAIFNKLLGFNLLYADVQEWWECIEDAVREQARIETNEMRLCIAEFEAPRNTISFFQQQRNKIATALCSIHQKVVEVNLQAAEVLLVDVELDCDLLGAYLFDLRSGVEEFEAIEEQILQGRRTNGQVRGIDSPQKLAPTSSKSNSGFKCYSRCR